MASEVDTIGVWMKEDIQSNTSQIAFLNFYWSEQRWSLFGDEHEFMVL